MNRLLSALPADILESILALDPFLLLLYPTLSARGYVLTTCFPSRQSQYAGIPGQGSELAVPAIAAILATPSSRTAQRDQESLSIT